MSLSWKYKISVQDQKSHVLILYYALFPHNSVFVQYAKCRNTFHHHRQDPNPISNIIISFDDSSSSTLSPTIFIHSHIYSTSTQIANMYILMYTQRFLPPLHKSMYIPASTYKYIHQYIGDERRKIEQELDPNLWKRGAN